MQRHYALVILLCLGSIASKADHLPGGSISTRCLGGNFHEITLTLLRSCTGTAMVEQGLTLSNDCGVLFSLSNMPLVAVEEVSPLCPDQLPNSTCNGGSLMGFELYTYRQNAYLSPCDSWRISWAVCCRNSTMNVQQNPGIFIEEILNNAEGRCDASPVFVDNTIPLVCAGQPVSYDASATDEEGNTLRYHLIDARFGSPEPVSVNYQPGYSGEEPYPGMEIDSITGRITFQPTATGHVVTVVQVSEYDEEGTLISSIMRDFQFVVSVCDNTVPSISSGTFTAVTGAATITGDRTLTVCTGEAFCGSLAFTDADLGQTLTLASNVTDILTGATLVATGANPTAAELCWNTDGIAAGTYQFTITATDDACPVVGFQQFDYSITVGEAGAAGDDTQVDYCEEAQPFPLFDQIHGNPIPDGTWQDTNGAEFDGIFEPGIDPPGDYTYTVGGGPTCTATSTITLSVLPPSDPLCIGLSVPDVSNTSLRILPDAGGRGRFRFSVPTTGTYKVSLISADGRIVLDQRISLGSGSFHPIDLGNVTTGTYLLRAVPIAGSQLFTSRLVVH